MRFLSRTVEENGNSFEMYYEVYGDNLILKDVIPEVKGTDLSETAKNKFHKETSDLMETYSNLDENQDAYYVSHLADRGIIITNDE